MSPIVLPTVALPPLNREQLREMLGRAVNGLPYDFEQTGANAFRLTLVSGRLATFAFKVSGEERPQLEIYAYLADLADSNEAQCIARFLVATLPFVALIVHARGLRAAA
jgi:hypothetical protein